MPEPNENTGGGSSGGGSRPGRPPSGQPEIYIRPRGDTIVVQQGGGPPPTINYVHILDVESVEVGNPESNTWNYNVWIWTIEQRSHGFTGEVFRQTRTLQSNNYSGRPERFLLENGVSGLNIESIETGFADGALGDSGPQGVINAAITCTPGTEDADTGDVTYGQKTTYILDLSYGISGNKTAPEGTERPNQIELPPGTPNYAAFKATVLGKGSEDGVEFFELDESWNEFKDQLPARSFAAPGFTPDTLFSNYTFTYKSNDREDLNTYLHFGDDKIYLTTNVMTDNIKYPYSPHSAIFKMYEPLPTDITEKDKLYICREVLPVLTETVELVSYDPEDGGNDVRDVVVLKTMDTLP
jgi:hypothetical protein